MFRPSWTTLLSGLFLAYMANSIWSIANLYFPPQCDPNRSNCLTNVLTSRPNLRLILLTSLKTKPSISDDFEFLQHVDIDDVSTLTSEETTLTVPLPPEVTKKNRTMYLGLVSVPLIKSGQPGHLDPLDIRKKWPEALQDPEATYSMVKLTEFQVPEAKTFNLIGEKKQWVPDVPVVHVKKKIIINIMADDVRIPGNEVPGEIYHLVRLRSPDSHQYLPMVYVDELSQRLSELVMVNKTDLEATIIFVHQTISWGQMRIFLQFFSALGSMQGLGFTPKDTDEVKGIFADTNIVLLMVTMMVSAVHLLFDFLAFKNDISFWQGRTNLTGLSTRTLVWRAFSQSVIFLYLLEENTSLLVLIPSGIAALIEWWKVTKAFGFSLAQGGIYRRYQEDNEAEKRTEQLDSEAMRYLSYVLYPLLVGGAGYSLFYTPHKSWWSWTIQSLVNAVYAFGFLFMLPQLFVNYRLKSVAHLPWRAFMYKAFNTFIDDLFAFIITMPTAHRVACFRDDVVFIIYLYQRYLYPVDKTRVDMAAMIDETPDASDVQEVTKNEEAGDAAAPATRRKRKPKAE